MPPTIRFKAIGDPRFDIKSVTKRLQAALDEEAVEHRKLLRMTTATWEGVKPKFQSVTLIGPRELSISTGPIGDGEGARKWRFLESGTRIRWAVMGPGWRSKTRAGRLASRRGRGRVVIFGKRAMMRRHIRPRPGIQARNWIAEVNKLRSRKFKGLLQRTFAIIAKSTITPGGLRS